MQEKECLFGIEDKKLQKMSYSKLSTMDKKHGGCPYKYKLVYIDNHFIDAPAIATEFGTLIHFVEEMMGKDIMANDNEPLFMMDYQKYSNLVLDGYHNVELVGKYTQKEADSYNEKHNLKPGDEKFKTTESDKYKIEHVAGAKELQEKFRDDWFKEDKSGMTYADKVASYLSKGIYRLRDYMVANPDLEIIGLEKEFNLVYDDYLFHGFIDRIFRDKATGEILIEDIKTYSKPLENKDLKTPLQFVFYTLAAREMFKTEHIRCSYEMPLISCKQDAGSSGYIDRGRKKINELLHEIEIKNFEPNPSPLCHWCIFSHTYPNQPDSAKNLCPYFSHWTKTNKDFSVENHWMGEGNHQAILEAFTSKNLRRQQPSKDIITIMKDPININSERKFRLRRS